MDGTVATQDANNASNKSKTIGQKLYAKALTVHAGNLVLKEGIEELDAQKVKNALEWAYPQFCHDKNSTYLHRMADVMATVQTSSDHLTQAFYIAKHLIDAGANVHTQNAAQKTALDVALDQYNHRLVHLLVEAGAVVDQNSIEMLSEMHKSSSNKAGQELSREEAFKVYNTLVAVKLTASHQEVQAILNKCIVEVKAQQQKGKIQDSKFNETVAKMAQGKLYHQKLRAARKQLDELQVPQEVVLELSIEKVVNALLPILTQQG